MQEQCYIQLELFEHKPSTQEIHEEIKILTEKYERVRKGLFARQTAIEYRNECLHKELEFLKAHICKG